MFSDFNEIESAIGTEIGASDWIEVTQERSNLFTEGTCRQWIQVDQQREEGVARLARNHLANEF